MRISAGQRVGLIAVAILVFSSGWAAAQGGPSLFQFSFSNPGARSLGLGGAFAAVADDATAAFANPAGLLQLSRPEVTLEGRHWDYSTPFTQGGRVSGAPTGIGLDTPIRMGEASYDTTALSFLSFVYPGRRWTLALSRHQLADFEALNEIQGLFTDDADDDPQPTCLPGTDTCRYPDFRQRIRTDFVTYSLSSGFRLQDNFSIGFGVSYFVGEIDIQREMYEISDRTLPLGFFGPSAFVPEALMREGDFSAEDTSWGLSAGFLWFIDRQWSLGGFYRSGPRFTMHGEERTGPALDPPIPTGTVVASNASIPITFPDVFGLGLAYRSRNGSWTASFEWDRVQYSAILESIPESDLISTTFVSISDANELRMGLEYVFRQLSPMAALRAGVWRDPDHSVRSVEDDPLEQALMPGGEDQFHFSLGGGVAFSDFQTDIAVDFSDLVTTLSFSLIYAF